MVEAVETIYAGGKTVSVEKGRRQEGKSDELVDSVKSVGVAKRKTKRRKSVG